jgi:hypothetical protein
MARLKRDRAKLGFVTMEDLAQRAAARNPADTTACNLFDTARERALWASLSASRIARRFGLPIGTAAAIAECAGLDIERAAA